jgi:hypothetical protein
VQDRQKPSRTNKSTEKLGDNLVDGFDAYIVDVNRYKKAKSEVGAFLNTRLNPQEAKAYRNTTERTPTDIFSIHEHILGSGAEANIADKMDNRSLKAEFAWAAKVILDFFFPWQTDDTAIRKYWGGIYDILSLPVSLLPNYSWITC